MNFNKEIATKKKNGKILPKIKSELKQKIIDKIKKEEDILLYKKLSIKTNLKNPIKNKKKKIKKIKFMLLGSNSSKILNIEKKKNDLNKNKIRLNNFNHNEFLERKSFIRELSERKKIFSEKVKLIKIAKKHRSPKPKAESSFELIRKYSLKVLVTNRSTIKTQKEKELFEKLEKIDKENLNEIKSQKIKNLPPLFRDNFSTINLQPIEKKNFPSRNKNENNKISSFQLNPINKRYLMLQYAENIVQPSQEKIDYSLNNNSNINNSNNRSFNTNQINLKSKIFNMEKESINEKLYHKIKTEFSFKEYNYLNYAIVPGNASYLVKNCMYHRTNWKEAFSTVTNMFNFKWQQNTVGINYSKLGSYGNIKQAVNHFENHFVLSNKANMFIYLMFYCEQRKISVFKYVPLTIIFDLELLNNKLDCKQKKKKIEQLKQFIEETAPVFVKQFNEIGNYFYEEDFKIENKKRQEYIKQMNSNRFSFKEYYSNSQEEENNKFEKTKFNSIYPIYSNYFGKPEIIERIRTTLENTNYDIFTKIRDFEKEMKQSVGLNTLIEIPETHSSGKNMWIVKALNLCQGKCMQIANNFNQILLILKHFKDGVDFNFTEKVLEETQDTEIKNYGKNEKKIDKDYSSLYFCDKIIIQKYIERPLLYYGRKFDMRVWVLVTHTMKVFFFKEGHLKTCSIPFDIESKDAYSHITNYSFQKHNRHFQKYEKGNEVPFYDFQKFLDEKYPSKHYIIKKNLYDQIKEIVSITMMSVKYQLNKNNRNYQFEIFGYDFMLDEEFNLFLIEINDDPGLEESSPWISVIIPRMLDDALRLTLDQIFSPGYDFSKKYKKEKKVNKIRVLHDYFRKNKHDGNKHTKTEDNINTKRNKSEKDIKRYNTENNCNFNLSNNYKEKQKENNKKDSYISPFPVPGYKNDEILWEFVCDLNGEDPLDRFLDKNISV